MNKQQEEQYSWFDEFGDKFMMDTENGTLMIFRINEDGSRSIALTGDIIKFIGKTVNKCLAEQAEAMKNVNKGAEGGYSGKEGIIVEGVYLKGSGGGYSPEKRKI